MTYFAAALIITSAFMHASWNYVSKRRSPTLAFFWITVLFSALFRFDLLPFGIGSDPCLLLLFLGLVF